MLAVGLATPAQAQRIELHARAGVVLSTPLVEDRVGTPAVRELLGVAVDTLVRVLPGTGMNLGLDVRVAFWSHATLDGAADWTRSQLIAEEDGRDRVLQTLHVLQATVGASWAVREQIELGGAVGLLRYVTDERGVFAGGGDVSPLAEARLALVLPQFSRRIALRLHAQTHRFGTAVIRERGGSDGSVRRYGAALRVRAGSVNP